MQLLDIFGKTYEISLPISYSVNLKMWNRLSVRDPSEFGRGDYNKSLLERESLEKRREAVMGLARKGTPQKKIAEKLKIPFGIVVEDLVVLRRRFKVRTTRDLFRISG